MKIVAWNAGMAFRKKIDKILPLKADILVISECEKQEKWGQIDKEKGIYKFLWEGDNPNKGIGIITFDKRYKIEIHPDYDKSFRYIVPIKVSAGNQEFIIFAVWSQKGEKRYSSYIGQIYLALEQYAYLLKEPCIIVGDGTVVSNMIVLKGLRHILRLLNFLKDLGLRVHIITFLRKNKVRNLKRPIILEKKKRDHFILIVYLPLEYSLTN